MKKYVIIEICLIFIFILVGCEKNVMKIEYERIKSSGLSGEALLNILTEFELKNPEHFSSNVDLGGYHLLTGNIQLAANFLQRAEEIIPKKPDKETRENISIMYGSMSRIYLLQNEYVKAMNYAEKAITADDEKGKHYRFLKAHILIAQNKYDQAIILFDELYQSQRDLMLADDIRAFMYLLATAGRYSDCAQMVDLYFEKGTFFNGLGLFASGAYENSGQINKSILAAFLDYEYYSSYNITDDRDFLENINTLERQLDLKGMLAETEATIRLIRSLYDDSSLIVGRNHSGFFVEDYCIFKKKILTNSLTFTEFQQYLNLEPYFKNFPVYYWLVWKAAKELTPDLIANYIPSLQLILILDQNGRYAQSAWEELTRFMGYINE
jgi:tetratricopeptide (TPR) repeat protein